jgi:hypothetical protein
LAGYTPEEFVKIKENDYIAKKYFEDVYLKCEEDLKIKYILKLWMGFFKNGMNNISLNELNKVQEEDVRKLFNGDPDLEGFIIFLFEKGKLL